MKLQALTIVLTVAVSMAASSREFKIQVTGYTGETTLDYSSKTNIISNLVRIKVNLTLPRYAFYPPIGTTKTDEATSEPTDSNGRIIHRVDTDYNPDSQASETALPSYEWVLDTSKYPTNKIVLFYTHECMIFNEVDKLLTAVAREDSKTCTVTGSKDLNLPKSDFCLLNLSDNQQPVFKNVSALDDDQTFPSYFIGLIDVVCVKGTRLATDFDANVQQYECNPKNPNILVPCVNPQNTEYHKGLFIVNIICIAFILALPLLNLAGDTIIERIKKGLKNKVSRKYFY